MHLVIFDIDGTLTESRDMDDRCYVQAVRETLGLESFSTDWAAYRDATDCGIAAEIIERHFGRAASKEDLSRVRERFVALLEAELARDRDSCRPVAGAIQMILQLLSHGQYGVALATGAWRESAMPKLARAGFDIARHRIPLATASEARSRPDIIRLARLLAESRYDVREFESAVSVGDAVWDAKAAASLGMPFIGIGRGERARQLADAGAVAVISDYREWDAFFEAIEQCCARSSRSG